MDKPNTTDHDEEVAQQISNMIKLGAMPMTVADLVNALAGLPPNMEVFVDAENTSLFLDDTEVQIYDNMPPFLRLKARVQLTPKAPSTLSHEEQVALKAQQSMELANRMEEATRMPRMVN